MGPWTIGPAQIVMCVQARVQRRKRAMRFVRRELHLSEVTSLFHSLYSKISTPESSFLKCNWMNQCLIKPLESQHVTEFLFFSDLSSIFFFFCFFSIFFPLWENQGLCCLVGCSILEWTMGKRNNNTCSSWEWAFW